MSFKREGDDTSQLNTLKKRRVADLLSDVIPGDEAALLSNGRYTCLVCCYRPVFDTVDTLTVHRNGKRHLEGLKSFYGKKARLRNEVTKRRHESYVQAEDTGQDASCSAPLLAQTRKITHNALLKTVPYSSRHTKTSTKSGKGPRITGSDPSDNASDKTPSQQDRRETDGSSPSICTAAGEAVLPSNHTKGADAAETPAAMTAERRREMEHYLKLKSDGWLRDRGGQWVRDENVEFDSDEEPPSLTPPPTSC